MERHPIHTPRLSLLPSSPDHAESLWEAVEASLAELKPWMPWASDDTYEQNREFLKTSQEAWQKDEAWTFTIFFEDRAAGTLGFSNFEPLLVSAQLGYWLRTDLAGRGFMTEAATAAVDFGFEELHLHRIELHAGLGNIASIRVAEKVGFRRAGMLRDSSRGESGWYDCYVFDLLETDVRPRLEPPR
jgi:ribosomal-protein-serine acetyltransferase